MWSGAIFIRLAILLATSVVLMGANLPKNVPVPEARPETTPVPESKDKVEKSKPQQPEPKGDKPSPKKNRKRSRTITCRHRSRRKIRQSLPRVFQN
jgi:hypothetical protein